MKVMILIKSRHFPNELQTLIRLNRIKTLVKPRKLRLSANFVRECYSEYLKFCTTFANALDVDLEIKVAAQKMFRFLRQVLIYAKIDRISEVDLTF